MSELTPEQVANARWQGEASRHMEETVRRFEGLNRRADHVEHRMDELSVEVVILKTKVGIYSALGAIVGGALVTVAGNYLGG
jgi:hypothetical protein